ncbi:MAG: hypothetical protein HY290_24435 [Planctomycetia bacterium]|nr:hypothetical protein [Planctomycetia bacterium]
MTNSAYPWTEMPQPSYWIQHFFALVLAQTVGGFVATSLVSGLTRSAVLLVVIPLISMLLCAAAYFRSRYSIVVVVIGTMSFAAAGRFAISIDHVAVTCFRNWMLRPN